MKWEHIDKQVCPVARTASLIGDRWTLLIIRDLFAGLSKFSELQKISGMNKHRLSDRLNRLVEHQVVEKVLYDEKRQRYQYQLTEKGIALFPVMASIVEWGNAWTSDADGEAVLMKHQCSHESTVSTVVKCQHCDEEVTPLTAMLSAGPGTLKKVERGETKYLSPFVKKDDTERIE